MLAAHVVGHVAQHVYLQAGSLNLDTVLVGTFDDRAVKRVLQLPREEEPLKTGMAAIYNRSYEQLR